MKYFSIAPEEIYTGAKWLDQEIPLDALSHPKIREIHVSLIQTFRHAHGKLEAYPRNIRVENAQFKNKISEIHSYFHDLPEPSSRKGFNSVHVTLNNFFFAKNQILIIMAGSPYALYELNRENERYLFGPTYFESIDWTHPEEICQVANPVISVSAGSPNWGHFLIDELPRLCAFIVSTPAIEEVNIYLTKLLQISVLL
jgi:hypothetical protein